jgi:hypothetical protein
VCCCNVCGYYVVITNGSVCQSAVTIVRKDVGSTKQGTSFVLGVMEHRTGKKNNKLEDATNGFVVTFARRFTLFSEPPLSAKSDLYLSF